MAVGSALTRWWGRTFCAPLVHSHTVSAMSRLRVSVLWLVSGLLLLVLAGLLGFDPALVVTSKVIAAVGVGVYVTGLVLFTTRHTQNGSENQI